MVWTYGSMSLFGTALFMPLMQQTNWCDQGQRRACCDQGQRRVSRGQRLIGACILVNRHTGDAGVDDTTSGMSCFFSALSCAYNPVNFRLRYGLHQLKPRSLVRLAYPHIVLVTVKVFRNLHVDALLLCAVSPRLTERKSYACGEVIWCVRKFDVRGAGVVL